MRPIRGSRRETACHWGEWWYWWQGTKTIPARAHGARRSPPRPPASRRDRLLAQHVDAARGRLLDQRPVSEGRRADVAEVERSRGRAAPSALVVEPRRGKELPCRGSGSRARGRRRRRSRPRPRAGPRPLRRVAAQARCCRRRAAPRAASPPVSLGATQARRPRRGSRVRRPPVASSIVSGGFTRKRGCRPSRPARAAGTPGTCARRPCLAERLLRPAVLHQLDADQQPLAAHVADELVLLLQLAEAAQHEVADPLGVLDQPLLLDHA